MDDQEYGYRILHFLEVWELCLSGCGLYHDLIIPEGLSHHGKLQKEKLPGLYPLGF